MDIPPFLQLFSENHAAEICEVSVKSIERELEFARARARLSSYCWARGSLEGQIRTPQRWVLQVKGEVSAMSEQPHAKAHILVVDDEEGVRDLLGDALRVAGYSVSAATDGMAALTALRNAVADLLVVDINMPVMDGFELLEQLRKKGDYTPALMLSARGEKADVTRGLRLGADDYVTKPFGLEELLLRVGAILRRTKAAVVENSVLRCGPLSLDEDQHKVFYSDQEVELSPTEFKLLQELMRNKGRVLTKSALLRDVWEIDFETETSVLDTYISYLRKKLNRDNLEFIRTVRGVGYQLVEPA
jgi:two-component system OmpR family response regulator